MKTTAELDTFVPPPERENIFRKLRDQGFVRNIETKVKSRDGKTRWVSTNIDRINLNGKDCFLTAAVEITARKEAEEMIRQLNAELEKKIKDRTAELIESQRTLRELNAHLQTIREEERTSIAREVHDVMGQQLTGLKMDMSWLSKKFGKKDKKIQEQFDSMLHLADEMVKSIRKIATDLRPGILDLGLLPALEWQSTEFEKRTGIKCHLVTGDSFPELPKSNATGIFRIYQETLTNVARHSGATKVEAAITCNTDEINFTISDNGKGLATDEMKHKQTLGIMGMKERAVMLGGELQIESMEGSGTRVILHAPVKKP